MSNAAIVSLTFDDGLRCQFERAVPILDLHGLPGTFFVVANTDKIHTDGVEHPDWQKTDWSEGDIKFLKGMIQRGHEVGSHSVSHRRRELNMDPKGEAENSKRWIEDRLEMEIPSYGYPFYLVTSQIRDAVIQARYRQARGGPGGQHYSAETQIDYFRVDCRQVGDNANGNVLDWLRPGCWHVLTFHGIGSLKDGWCPVSEAEFARQMSELATHWNSGAVEVVTFKDGADRLRRRQQKQN